MKKQYNSMYLGMCINNNDPEKRGRVQVFIPHIMPALYEEWNEEGKDIEITCVGDNMPEGLSSSLITKLTTILPWAEAASPIVGTSSPGNLITKAANAIKDGVQAAQKGLEALFFDQSPEAEPANIQDLQGLFEEANKWVGNDARGSKVKGSYATSKGPGNCLRGSQGILGALTGHQRFNANKGGLGAYATLYSGAGSQNFVSTGLYDAPVAASGSYMGDSSQWQVGDVVACSGGGKGYGHIQVWTGKAWVSDFTQNRILPRSSSGSYNDFVVHRPNAAGREAIAKRTGGMNLGATNQSPGTTSVSGEVAAANVHQNATPTKASEEETSTDLGSVADPTMSPEGEACGAGSAGINLSQTQSTSMQMFKNNYAKNQATYQQVSDNLKAKGYDISPQQIAAIHWREGSGSMKKTIANGRPLDSYIRKDGLYEEGSTGNSYTRTNDWATNATEVMEHKLLEKFGSGAKGKSFSQDNAAFYDFAERYNGLGYRKKGVPSPYVWAGTDQYTGGKYVKDGVYDPNYVDQQLGVAAMVNALDGAPITTTAGDLASQPITSGGGGLVNNTDKHGPTVTQNLNNVAKGLFTFPAAGAMLWVFFREGNPLYPVYFAASYSKEEWGSAYGLGSDGPGYRPTATEDNPATSTGGMMNLNGVGGMRWESTSNPANRLEDQKSIMFFGEDGSNMFMGKGYHQIFSKFDRRDQVEGDRWSSTLGFKENMVQGDSNDVVLGDVFIKVGNVSQSAVDAVQKIQEIITDIQKPLSESSS
jgi:lysozyme family protein